LDDASAHLRTHEKADFLLETFEAGIVWDEYGIRSDVVVSGFFLNPFGCLDHVLFSHLPMIFHEPTFMSLSHLIYSINSSKESSKTI
jgi:hypothetical protein